MLDRLHTWRHEVLNAWRDVDSTRLKYGVVVSNSVVTMYVGHRCYRVSWWQP